YTYSFYVDNVLGRSFTGAYTTLGAAKPDDIVVAGLGAGTSTGDMWTDGIKLVQGQAYVSQHPQGQTNSVGTDITVTAQAIGSADTVFYQWRKNGTAIAGATDTSYTITNAQTSNSGNYSFVASNSLDVAVSLNAYVQVNPLLLITVQPTNQTVNLGSNA